ncbi:hypothetical protein VPNG_05506 [Cytospora leucostoma]|uniref:DNA replication factor Cdt1 C-terminal domain-containing protein n=1 Tax=Cytospora leucostoma TaxID=1230097 RepID=A0A423XBT0_9PEZI|nr:hypothetical protein VPNG_05506 [Cytospora leucostoma]
MPGATATGRSRGRPRKNPVESIATADIASFTRVSKNTTIGQEAIDKKIAIQTVEVHDITAAPVIASARKRKAARSPEPEEVTANIPAQRQSSNVASISKSVKKQKRVQAPEAVPLSAPEQPPSTPRRAVAKRALSPEIESPRTREAGNLFKRLRIGAPLAIARTASPLTTTTTTTTTQASTPATSVIPDSEDEDEEEYSAATTPDPESKPVRALPQELLDIVSLYTAFLKTITVHYAHNGTNTPVDLRQISQPVSLAWGKRRISLADIRRCVGIMDIEPSSTKSPFYLVDYGNKKTCVELRDEHRGRPLDERGLVSVFEANVRYIWEGLSDAAAATARDDMTAFVLGLPKSPVQTCEALSKASSALARGQRAMQELKAGVAARKEEEQAATRAATAPTTTTTTNSAGQPATKLSLLDRLRLKETHLAQLAATGPTRADLERRAALQRAGDVAAVIAMLSRAASSSSPGGGARVSFTMAALLQRLGDSLRLPVSREEGAACVRVLAGEAAPEWLRIVVAAGRENVVVQVGRAPSAGALAERVRVLSA